MPTPSRPPLDVLQRARTYLGMECLIADIDCRDVRHVLVRDLLALVLDNPHRQALVTLNKVNEEAPISVIELREALRDADRQVGRTP